MSSASVHAWLQGQRPFEEGVALLRAAGEEDEALLFFLSLGETTVSRRHLEDALTAIRRAAVQRTLSVQDSTPGHTLVTKADIRAERVLMARDPRTDGLGKMDLPPELAALHDALPEMFREMNYLRARLETLPDEKDRYRDCARIAAIDKHAVSVYARIDTWQQTGRDPGASPPPPATNGARLQRELLNITSYLARHNTGARPASPKKVLDWEARKTEIQQQLDALSE